MVAEASCPVSIWREEHMQEHVHTGFASVVFAGVSAILVIQVLRLTSAWMISSGKAEPAGRVIGALVHFS